KLEEDLSSLSLVERNEYLEMYDLKQSSLDTVIAKTYNLLGLKTYLTSGPDECRAWTFIDGMNAKECAGIIHSDFEKGFIRAEILSYEDLYKYKSYISAKENGKVRLEGKEYKMQDGDIVVFRFNV
ncbi:MAG: DUF933 domain-containing protein, partial [Acholeplasmatales bacterium]|nr:DUF933 domain-containing protein [Acholeplasmatales bacterium]